MFLYLEAESFQVFTIPNAVLFFGVLLSIGNGIIILINSKNSEIHKTQIALAATYKENWDSAIKLNKISEDKLLISEAEKLKATDEASIFRSSYTALASIAIKELINFDQIKRERDALEKECVELHQRLQKKIRQS